ncbi:MAG TPA: hypothetical protein VN685_06190 [Rhizomicrobium sp.]|jgi:hypothetical protein|nr:hypothetical protein [Rhizomicrobium sp.]
METRTVRKQVTFSQPFQLAGCDGAQPPGSYTLTLEEEQLDVLLFVGWRQSAATLQLTHGGTTDYVAVDMQELTDALLRDSDPSTDPPATPAAAKAQSRARQRLARGS